MKADAGGRELFSGFHFGMDDWANEFYYLMLSQTINNKVSVGCGPETKWGMSGQNKIVQR
jgi:hypothetical protein